MATIITPNIEIFPPRRVILLKTPPRRKNKSETVLFEEIPSCFPPRSNAKKKIRAIESVASRRGGCSSREKWTDYTETRWKLGLSFRSIFLFTPGGLGHFYFTNIQRYYLVSARGGFIWYIGVKETRRKGETQMKKINSVR